MTRRVVVDTSAISVLLAGRTGYRTYERRLGDVNFVSVVTLAELLRGAYSSSWGSERTDTMRAFVGERFVVLTLDEAVAEVWAELVAACVQNGYVPSANDAWIAATAVVAACPILSADDDFHQIARHYPRLDVIA